MNNVRIDRKRFTLVIKIYLFFIMVLIIQWLSAGKAHASYNNKLVVDVIQDEQNVLLKHDSIFYTDKDVTFYPGIVDYSEVIASLADEIKSEYVKDTENEEGNFTNTSSEFSGYYLDDEPVKEMKEDSFVLYCPKDTDEYKEHDIVFIKTVAVYVTKTDSEQNETVIGSKEVVFESEVFRVVFDKSHPNITVSGKLEDDGIFKAPATVQIRANDIISGIRRVSVLSEKEIIADIDLSGEGRITEFINDMELPLGKVINGIGKIDIVVTDNCNLESIYSFQYRSDTESPKIIIQGIDNGMIYKDKTEALFVISDNSKGINVKYSCRYIDSNGKEKNIEEYEEWYEGNYAELKKYYQNEGVYEVSIECVDSFGNESGLLYRSFGIDNTSPVVFFDGIEQGALLSDKADLGINVNELFFEDMDVDVKVVNVNNNVYMNIPVGEYDYEAVSNKNTYSFSGNGTYIVNVCATDSCGHKSESSMEFTIDTEPPQVSIVFNGESGIGSALLNEIPDISVQVVEQFFENTSLEVSLIKKKEGNIYEPVPVNVPKLTSMESIIPVPISEEGIYELKVLASDPTGNYTEKRCGFTIDATPPAIGYLSNFNEKYLKSFKLPDNLSSYISDMTDVKYRAYLNSKETGPGEIKKDGKYILQVVASDDAGNESEETIAFIIDNTKPSVVISGLNENGEIQRNVPVVLSLYNSDDFFTEVYVNGSKKPLSKDRKTCEFSCDDDEIRNNCRIYISARDEANNVLTQTIDRKCAVFSAAPVNLLPEKPEIISLTKVTTEMSIDNDMELLTKSDEKFLQKKNSAFSSAIIWIICGIICVLTIILVVFAFVDSAKNKC